MKDIKVGWTNQGTFYDFMDFLAWWRHNVRGYSLFAKINEEEEKEFELDTDTTTRELERELEIGDNED